MTEQTYEEQIARADRARQLRDDPLIKGFIDRIRETTYENIRTSNYKAVDEREELYKMLKVVDAFEKEFKRAMDDGKVAASRLDKLRQKIGI